MELDDSEFAAWSLSEGKNQRGAEFWATLNAWLPPVPE
jgi:hypothetical protein